MPTCAEDLGNFPMCTKVAETKILFIIFPTPLGGKNIFYNFFLPQVSMLQLLHPEIKNFL